MLNVLVPNKTDSWWIGPDSMKIDQSGAMYVAQWEGGRVLKISPDGKLLQTFDIAAGLGTMNVALDAGENNLYVAVAHDLKDPHFNGAIVKLPNVK